VNALQAGGNPGLWGNPAQWSNNMSKYGSAPAPFIVLADYRPPNKKQGDPYTARLGGYQTLTEALAAIKKEEASRVSPETFGGLIDWGDLWKASYRIFQATYKSVS